MEISIPGLSTQSFEIKLIEGSRGGSCKRECAHLFCGCFCCINGVVETFGDN